MDGETHSWFYAALFSFIFFTILNKLLSLFCPPPVLSCRSRTIWLWGNISCSFVHSCTTAVLSVYSLWEKPEMMEDMITSWNVVAYYTLAFSVGYFVYDFVSLALNDADKSLCLFLHHFIVTSAFMIVLVNKNYIPFGMVALLMEINSIFLHVRRLMRISGSKPSSKLYKVNAILLVVTFIIFRLITCGWMLNYLVSHRNILPTFHFAVGTAGMCALIPQNIVLLKQIWTSDSKHAEKGKENQKELCTITTAPNGIVDFKQFLRTIIDALE